MYVIKKPLSSVVVLTTFLLTTSAFAMDTGFTDMPQEVKGLAVRQAAYKQCLEDDTSFTVNKTLGNLSLVCKKWQEIIEDEKKVGAPSWKAWYGVRPENEHIYQQFLNGTLIYRPNPQSDEGMIQLKISCLINPLEGTFDLSQCGDMGQYFSISTGHRKGMKAGNSKKLEIWITPRFMIEKKLKSSAKQLQPIMGNWKEEIAPIGILWTWGGWDHLNSYFYLTDNNLTQLSSQDLYKGFTNNPSINRWEMPNSVFGKPTGFSCSFLNQNLPPDGFLF